MCDAHGDRSMSTKKHLQIKTDHRSLWWNDDQSSKFVPIPNTIYNSHWKKEDVFQFWSSLVLEGNEINHLSLIMSAYITST